MQEHTEMNQKKERLEKTANEIFHKPRDCTFGQKV